MVALHVAVLEAMDAAFQDYAAALPKPVRVQQERGWMYRFKDRDIYHAVVLKLALVQSTLRAALTLLQAGHVLEQAMLQRVLDEANEDILFLAYAITNDEITDLHKRYLDAFWAEEFEDFEDPTNSHRSRDMVPRKKIRAYLARIEGKGLDPSRAAQVTKVIGKTYSGFVHGASPHIMELYGGAPPRFHTRGLAGTPRTVEYGQDIWNYIYRSLLSHMVAAKLFGSTEHLDFLAKYKRKVEVVLERNHEDAKA